MAERTVKAVSGLDEHEDFPGQTLITRDHEVIRTWASRRGGVPATVPGGRRKELVRELRLRLPGSEENLSTISWDEWLRAFDTCDFRFIYREHEADGQLSGFFVLDTSAREEG